MRQIFKYPVDKPIVGRIEKFLHIEYQYDTPMIWAIVDDACPQVEYLAVCIGTGWPLPDFANEFSYIGTIQDDDGYVWHYFVVPVEVVKAANGRSYDKPKKETVEEDVDAISALDEELGNMMKMIFSLPVGDRTS